MLVKRSPDPLIAFDQFLIHRRKSLFGQLPLGDVDGRANVTGKRRVHVVSRHAHGHHPAILAVVAAEPMLHLKRLTLLEGLLVHLAVSPQFVYVESLAPSSHHPTTPRSPHTANESPPLV
jgi:hypothetical protein